MANSPTPAGLKEQIRAIAQEEVRKFANSGFLRNAAITQGGLTVRGEGGITIDGGGAFRITGLPGVEPGATGSSTVYMGGVTPAMPDGTPQPGLIFRREDGTVAMALYDPTPDPDVADGFNQFLAIFDRQGNIVFSDDTASGQGIARPGLSGGFAATQSANFGCSTTSGTFVTVADQWVTKQQPRLDVLLRAAMDTSGATGEVRVLVDGVQIGPTTSEAFVVNERFFGPAPVAGSHMQEIHVEIQGRRTSATGALRIEPWRWRGRQS